MVGKYFIMFQKIEFLPSLIFISPLKHHFSNLLLPFQNNHIEEEKMQKRKSVKTEKRTGNWVCLEAQLIYTKPTLRIRQKSNSSLNYPLHLSITHIFKYFSLVIINWKCSPWAFFPVEFSENFSLKFFWGVFQKRNKKCLLWDHTSSCYKNLLELEQ